MMSTIDNPESNNWVRNVLTLDIARDALQEFVERKNKINHESLIQKISATCSSCDFNTCTTCQNNTCTNKQLKEHVTMSHVKHKPSFDNTSPKDCWSQPWEFAKCFMPPNGYRAIKTAAGTDLSGLLSVIVNNLDFKAAVSHDYTKFTQAREVRNKIMHTPRLEVDDQTFKENTDVISHMLTCIPITEKTKSALFRIDELSRCPLTIITEDNKHVLLKELELCKHEIQQSMPKISELSNLCKQEIKDETHKSVQCLERKVQHGVNIIKRKTEEGIEQLQNTTAHGLEDIKKAAEAINILFAKQDGFNALACKTNEEASQLQYQHKESTFALQKTLQENTKSRIVKKTANELENEFMQCSGTMQDVVQDLSAVKPKQQKELPYGNIDVRLKSVENYCFITGIVKVDVDRIAVVDSYNNRIKIISVNSNTIASFVNVDDPFGITRVNDKELVVSCGGSLKLLDLKEGTLNVGREPFDFEEWCNGVDYTEVGELFAVSFEVKDSAAVKIINTEGTINRLILQTKQRSYYIKFSNDGKRIYVTDNILNHILCLSVLDGTVLHCFEHANLEGPRGIAVDKADNVYIAGKQSNNIHIFSPDCSHLSICLDKRNGIENPTAIAYSEKEHALYVSHRAHGKKVHHIHPLTI